MNRFLLGLVTVMLLTCPAYSQENDFDLDAELEHLELTRVQSEFEFEQEMRGIELEERHLELAMMHREIDRPQEYHKEKHGGLFLICAIVHILMAIWVYQDVRRKNNGNGVWIVITLLAGFFGASVYALIRLGDCSPMQEE